MMDEAEIASGGDTIPPNINPSASVNPGISALETIATTKEVIITTGKAKLVTILRHRHNSFHEVAQAASYSNGGRKIKKTRFGLMVIAPNPSIKLKTSPPNTSTIG